MLIIESAIATVSPFIPFVATVFACAGFLWLAHWLLIRRRPELGSERMFSRQLIMLGLTLASIVVLALSLPVSESSRNQVIGLIGLVISGILAFSSTTIFANLMAGIMLRVTKPFRTGDFVDIGEYSGRIAERGLLDTEIQTESRQLVAVPNTFLITNPISVVRASGTVISVTLSLGYDVHHARIEPLLIQAVKATELEDPFIQILELGNYAITYKASGMLTDTKILLTARSNLCRNILDVLHNNDIEIMSPSFMNQRPLTNEQKAIPPRSAIMQPQEQTPAPEEVIFDKAEQAEQAEKEKLELVSIIQKHEESLEAATEDDKKRIKELIKEARENLKAYEKSVIAAKQNDTADAIIADKDIAKSTDHTVIEKP